LENEKNNYEKKVKIKMQL